jgi:hypothetical protein
VRGSGLSIVALDHVGIAASDAKAHPLVKALAVESLATTLMPSGVRVARFGPREMLELVTPARPGNPIERFLENRGGGLHHLALAVSEPLTSLTAHLAALGLEPIGAVELSSDGRPSLFLHPSTTGGILVELVETGSQ